MRHHKAILFKRLSTLFVADQEESSYAGSKANEVETALRPMQQKLSVSGSDNGGDNKDLKLFGTPQGIINVASGTVRISNDGTVIKFLRTEKQIEEERKKDIKRFSTSQGIINVAVPERKRIVVKKPMLRVPSNIRDETKYEQDLERFGTMQGIINVSNDEISKKNVSDTPTVKPVLDGSQNPYSERYREFSKAQVTLKNLTGLPKEITLWRKNPNEAPGPAGYENIESQVITSTISTGIHPQGITYNPANNCMYAVNQLSATVTIVNSDNQVIHTVQLEPSFPGTCSPVSVAVNTNTLDPNYGLVYIACCVSNTIQFLNLNHSVQYILPVGNRPVSVVFNIHNNLIYAANLTDDTISVITHEGIPEIINTLASIGQAPIGLGVNSNNGDLYCCNSESNSVSIYSSQNELVYIIKNTGQRPTSATYNPANGSMYVTVADSNLLLKINALNYFIEMHLAVGTQPYNAFYVKDNNCLYVQNREDNTLTVINSNDEFLAALALGEQNVGGAYNPNNHTIYVTDTLKNSINVISFGAATNEISISTGYAEIQEEFKNNFAIIQHARFVMSGDERVYGFKLNRSNATGMATSRALSMEQFVSPQNRQNVIECSALAGTLIDGKTNWKFMLPAYNSVSVLIWFKQFTIANILPKHIRNPNNKR